MTGARAACCAGRQSRAPTGSAPRRWRASCRQGVAGRGRGHGLRPGRRAPGLRGEPGLHRRRRRRRRGHGEEDLRDHGRRAEDRRPFVFINDSGGARIQEGVDSWPATATSSTATSQLSGVVPQISIIAGPCAGGAAYSPALTDFIIQVRSEGQMYITGPQGHQAGHRRGRHRRGSRRRREPRALLGRRALRRRERRRGDRPRQAAAELPAQQQHRGPALLPELTRTRSAPTSSTDRARDPRSPTTCATCSAA
jgi:hypothetical protein